jgi:hypothetical protein
VELIAPHIYSKNARRSPLQQHLRKAARGGTRIEARAAGNLETGRIERGAELQGGSGNIMSGFRDLHGLLAAHFVSGLEHCAPAETNCPAPDQILCFRPRRGESTLNQKPV